MPARTKLLSALALLPSVLAPPLGAQDLAAIRATETQLRRELRQDELLVSYAALLPEGTPADQVPPEVTARIAALSLERQALSQAAPLAELRALSRAEQIARVGGAALGASEALAAAGWLFLVDAVEPGEAQLARARDLDPGLKNATDQLLAAARGEPVPDGGYHRYRGRFLPLATRDRARAIDDALGALHALGGPALPFTPAAGTTDLDRFLALGEAGPTALRSAAAAVRASLRPDYDQVRGWLASYARSDSQRSRLLEIHAALQPARDELLALIGRYDKPEQPDVDARRAALEKAYDGLAQEVARDRTFYDRARPAEAHALLDRAESRERALVLVDACLRREAGDGLGPAPIDRPAGAATGGERLLPGREQSGLEDVLWLLAHLRAGQARDVLDRGEDLLRLRGQLTPWEAWLVEELLADAVDLYNDQAAFSLDATEWQFVGVLNRYRRVLGLRPFELEERLNASSRKHSQEMVDLGYFGHISPVARNRGPTDRARLEGYGGGVGENCLAGQVDGRGAFEAWYRSPGHHRGMVARSPQLGVGAVNGHAMWTMVMGGTDLGWRALHADLPPERHAALHALALDFARVAHALGDQGAKADQGIAAARATLDREFPAVLPKVARLGFEAAKDERHTFHRAAPALLAYLVDADLPVTWRPLQIAAVAAAIDLLQLSGNTAVRTAAFDLVRPLCGETFGYRPDGGASERLAATLKIRAAWEDHAQWSYRRSGPPPEVAGVPGRGDGPSAKAKLAVLAKPERLRLARQFGGGTDTERAIDLALAWLAKAQDQDGAWRARAFVLNDPRFDARHAGLGNAEWDIAMTGLSILAFVSSGHTPEQGDHRETLQRAVRWLAGRVVDYGKFETVSGHYMYGHAIATQALCEVFAYTADPQVGATAQLALDYIAFAQDAGGGGWRYDARQAGDTSVVGWVVMALNSGYKAGLDVVGFRDAIRFLDAVTLPGYYQVGYTGRPDIAAPENLRLTSVGMVSRLFLGQEPGHPKIAMPSWRLLEQLPQRDRADFYYWYYATLAMFQVGGEGWKTWNGALKKALLDLQDQNRGSAYLGSWPPDGAYGGTGGRIYQTALGVLMLTTYYRYDRAPKIKVHPFTGDLREVAAPYLDRLRGQPDERQRALVLSRLVDELGPSLVPVLLEVAADPKEPKELRQLLAGALTSVAATRHEAQILPLLGADDGEVAAQAARALVEIGSEQSADAMIQALGHGHRSVRAFAARALGRLGVAAAVQPLAARQAVEGDGHVKGEIAAALRQLAQRDDLARLVDRALPPGTPGRLATFEGLALLEAEGMTARILALEAGAPKLFETCVATVAENRGGAIVPLLIVMLEAEDIETRRSAIKLLQAITRHVHGYRPEAEARDRKLAIRDWQRWWKQAGAGYGAGR
jgi:hypothetical protein